MSSYFTLNEVEDNPSRRSLSLEVASEKLASLQGTDGPFTFVYFDALFSYAQKSGSVSELSFTTSSGSQYVLRKNGDNEEHSYTIEGGSEYIGEQSISPAFNNDENTTCTVGFRVRISSTLTAESGTPTPIAEMGMKLKYNTEHERFISGARIGKQEDRTPDRISYILGKLVTAQPAA